MTGYLKIALQRTLRVYAWVVSPLIGGNCRFYPSCSNYAYQAIEEHGALRGSWLAIKRVTRCHPWHPGGVDLVPEPGSEAAQKRQQMDVTS